MQRRQPDPRDLQDQQHRQQKDQQRESVGHQMQQEQLRGLLENPQNIDKLLEADLTHDPQWIDELAGQHLHRDEVLSIHTDDDIWRKSWNNKLWVTLLGMTFPDESSRSPSDRVNKVQRRMTGVDHEPLTPRKKQRIEAKFEQKSDRARRAASGKFLDLLLTQVVRSEETSDDSGESGLVSGLLGGGGR